MTLNLITIANFPEPIEANIVKGQLEANGIKCIIKNEAYLNLRPLHTVAMGGIELQVRAEDAKKAREIVDNEYLQ